jgi:hypothetical protein
MYKHLYQKTTLQQFESSCMKFNQKILIFCLTISLSTFIHSMDTDTSVVENLHTYQNIVKEKKPRNSQEALYLYTTQGQIHAYLSALDNDPQFCGKLPRSLKDLIVMKTNREM